MTPPGFVDGDDGLLLAGEHQAVHGYGVVQVVSLSLLVYLVLKARVILVPVLVSADIWVDRTTEVSLRVEPSLIGPVILPRHGSVGEIVCGGVVVMNQQGEDSPAYGGECEQVLLVGGYFEQK